MYPPMNTIIPINSGENQIGIRTNHHDQSINPTSFRPIKRIPSNPRNVNLSSSNKPFGNKKPTPKWNKNSKDRGPKSLG
jgi:hypothetical protein